MSLGKVKKHVSDVGNNSCRIIEEVFNANKCLKEVLIYVFFFFFLFNVLPQKLSVHSQFFSMFILSQLYLETSHGCPRLILPHCCHLIAFKKCTL